MTFADLADIAPRELVPGFHGKMIHTDRVTVAFWDVEAGATLPPHSHPHEQITTLLSGRFELTVAGETRHLEAGALATIPGDVVHSGTALTPCRILDVFSPPREDYR